MVFARGEVVASPLEKLNGKKPRNSRGGSLVCYFVSIDFLTKRTAR